MCCWKLNKKKEKKKKSSKGSFVPEKLLSTKQNLHVYIHLVILVKSTINMAQLARAAEYTNCISAEG